LDKSRVYVFAEGADDGSIYGTPALESGFNDLMNLTKVGVAAAEGLFKNAKQRLHINIKDENVADAVLNGSEEKDFEDTMRDFAAGFDAEFFTSGMEVATLQSSITDPTGASNIALQAFCTSVDIPKTVLIGFETGERSSTENSSTWDETNNSRRENVLTPMIVGFLKHLVNVNILPKPTNGIEVVWDDLGASSDQEKLSNAGSMADINQKNFSAGGSPVFEESEIREAAGYEELEEDIDRGEEENTGTPEAQE
jgi:hypothetical protein